MRLDLGTTPRRDLRARIPVAAVACAVIGALATAGPRALACGAGAEDGSPGVVSAGASERANRGPDSAGMRADRACYGIFQPLIVTIDLGAAPEAPLDSPASGVREAPVSTPNASVLLFEPDRDGNLGGSPIATAPVKPIWAEPQLQRQTRSLVIKVDLAEMFPRLWTDERPRLLGAQLVVEGARRGAPLMLEPMMSPAYAARSDRSGAPMFIDPESPRKTYSGLRAFVRQTLVMDTSVGEMEFALRPDQAPNTVLHFCSLVRDGFYIGTTFHRVAALSGASRPDIVQGGDPLGNGLGGCGEFIDLENSRLPHDFGVLSMARMSDPNSASSQFVICLTREGTRSLDGKYASFGQLIRGGEALAAIAKSPVRPDQKPMQPPVVRRMWLQDSPPAGAETPVLKDPFAEAGGR